METAPLLSWIALSQIFFTSAPLDSDIPILLERKRGLVIRKVIDLGAALALLALAAPFGIEAIAVSRFVHGAVWLAIFASFLQRVIGFSWGHWLAMQLRNAVATLLAVAPALLFYAIWDGPAQAGFLQILASAACGAALWFLSLRPLNHPAWEEVTRIAGPKLAPLLRRFGVSRAAS